MRSTAGCVKKTLDAYSGTLLPFLESLEPKLGKLPRRVIDPETKKERPAKLLDYLKQPALFPVSLHEKSIESITREDLLVLLEPATCDLHGALPPVGSAGNRTPSCAIPP